MTPFHRGFTDELVKTALLGGLGSVAKLVARNPMTALGVATVAGGTGIAATRGFKEGLHGGEKGRYLSASKYGPSEAAYTNYHPMFEHKPTRASWRGLHEFYRPGAFRR